MSQALIMDDRLEQSKQLARMLYLAHALTFFFTLGTLSVIPLLINYIKRPDTAGTLVHSHHSWMIRSFWIYLICMVVGWIFFVTFIGIVVAVPLWAIAWLWKAYRLIKGFVDLNNNRAMDE